MLLIDGVDEILTGLTSLLERISVFQKWLLWIWPSSSVAEEFAEKVGWHDKATTGAKAPIGSRRLTRPFDRRRAGFKGRA